MMRDVRMVVDSDSGCILTGDFDHVELEVEGWGLILSRMVGIMGVLLMLVHFIHSFESTLAVRFSTFSWCPSPTQNLTFHMKHSEFRI